jgi:hypothetical protein
MPAALRLSFIYRDGKWVLTGSRRLQMRVPAASRVQRFDEGAGAWIEIRDAAGKPLYRRVVSRSAVSDDVEVRTNNPDQRVVRRTLARRTGTFHAIVPDLEGAREFALLERRQVRGDDKTPKLDTLERARIELRNLDVGKGDRR